MTFLHRKLIALGAVVLLCGSGLAQARDYQIEVVLFENTAGRDLSAGGMYFPRIENTLRLGTEQAVANGFLVIEQGLTLTEDAAEIAASRSYRLLRHLSWRQPGLADEEAIAVRVALGNTVPMYIPQNLREYPEFFPAAASPTANRTEAINSYTVNGTIKVRLGRFLHMDTRLVYTDDETAQSFRLSQSRKMRSGELHYIDNPRFGLLTRITPLDDKAGTAADEPTDNAELAPE